MASTVTAHGQRLHYTDHGGTGPALVLLHSFLMDGEMLAPQVAAFGQEFRCVTVDERGHGQTPADGPFSYWDVAADVLDLLDELGIEQTAVLGCSQGGFVALRMALLAPQRITALALLGTSGAAEDPTIADSYRQLAVTWVDQGPIAPVLDLVATICFGGMDVTATKEIWRTRPTEAVEVSIAALVDRDDVLARLIEVGCPALVLHGSADMAYPLERARELVDALPGAQPLVVVEGGAHFLSATDPDEVNAHVGPFLRAAVSAGV